MSIDIVVPICHGQNGHLGSCDVLGHTGSWNKISGQHLGNEFDPTA